MPGEADDEVARPPGRQLEQRAAVDEPCGDVAHVVDRASRSGTHRRPGRRAPPGAAASSGSGLARAPGQVREQPRARARRRLRRRAATSARRRCAPCTRGPPSSSRVDRSRVTRSTTAGPVRNIRASVPAMIVRSPSAGEYAAPPAHGPPMTLICGTRRQRLRAEDRRVRVERGDALLQAGAAGVREADDRHAGRVGARDRAGDRVPARARRASRLKPAVLRPRERRAAVDAPGARRPRRRRPRCATA